MTRAVINVKTAAALQDALRQPAAQIEVEGELRDLPTLHLPAATRLKGIGEGAALHFRAGLPGLLLSADHTISNLRLETDETQIALGLSDDADDLGTLDLGPLTLVGRFHLEGTRARRGDLQVRDVHVERADARLVAHRPAGFGVEVLPGAFTIHNLSRDTGSHWTLEATNISAGSEARPVQGSGVFVFGGAFVPLESDPQQAPAPTQPGGSIELKQLTTGTVHSNGGIPAGAPNLITGGVFVGSGVHAQTVTNVGEVTTYGVNDMVLDNWGQVDTWIARSAITSRGASGIGFVNFGDLKHLRVQAPIETFGLGARGFNLYDGTLQQAEFRSITTHGDGAVGLQLSKPFGTITVDGDIRTTGGEGDSLVRGQVVRLQASALSFKEGTRGETFTVRGQVVAEHPGTPAFDFAAPVSVVNRVEVGGQPLT